MSKRYGKRSELRQAVAADAAYRRREDEPKRLCWYCGAYTVPAQMVPGLIGFWRRPGIPHPPNLRTKDHVLPKSRGGVGSKTVKIVACAACNARKANLTLEEYRTLVFANEEGKFHFEVMGWKLPQTEPNEGEPAGA